MHAPATPGTSDSGGAAGSDSDQGSGSIGSEELPAGPTVDQVYLGTGYDYFRIDKDGERQVYNREYGEFTNIALHGENIEDIKRINAALLVDGNSFNLRVPCGYRAGDGLLVGSVSLSPEASKITVEKVILDDVVLIDLTDMPIHTDEPETEMCTLTLVKEKGERSSVNGAGTYPKGTEVTISVVEGENEYFSAWSDGDKNPTRIIVLDQDMTLTAKFSAVFI